MFHIDMNYKILYIIYISYINFKQLCKYFFKKGHFTFTKF